MQWPEKNVCVVGLGRSGKAAINLLLQRGAKVVAFDDDDTSLPKSEILSYEQRGVIFLNKASEEFSDKNFVTCAAKPPIAPSSTVINDS